eukprot:6476631-Alexandrium_andersonii.AAC.1
MLVHVPHGAMCSVDKRWQETLGKGVNGKQEVVALSGCARVLASGLDDILAQSGRGGIFIRRVAQDRELAKEAAVDW